MMCQLCIVNHVTAQIRWPKPLTPLVKDLEFLITCIHDEYNDRKSAAKRIKAETPAYDAQHPTAQLVGCTYDTSKTNNTHPESADMTVEPEQSHRNHPPEVLMDLGRTLIELIDILDDARKEWWISPAKSKLRAKFNLERDSKALQAMHAINNKAADHIREVKLKISLFVKWSLELDGGMDALRAEKKT